MKKSTVDSLLEEKQRIYGTSTDRPSNGDGDGNLDSLVEEKMKLASKSSKNRRSKQEDEGDDALAPPSRPGGVSSTPDKSATEGDGGDLTMSPTSVSEETEDSGKTPSGPVSAKSSVSQSGLKRKATQEKFKPRETTSAVGAVAVAGMDAREDGAVSTTASGEMFVGDRPQAQVDAQRQSQPAPQLAIAAEVADSQVQEEVRRALAGDIEAGGSEIQEHIDAHVRRVLAERTVEAEVVEPMPEEGKGQGSMPKRKRRIIIAVILLLVVGIAVGVAVPLASSSGGRDSNDTPTMAPRVWQQIGLDIEGPAALNLLGISTSISEDGSVLAAGAPGNAKNGFEAGAVQVFKYDTSSLTWNRTGQELNGDAAEDFFGFSLSLSGAGDVVAVGASTNDANGEDAGLVRVFQFDAATQLWTRLGQDVFGLAAGEVFGDPVALSRDGTVFAASAIGSSSTRVYRYDAGSSQWLKLGEDIVGSSLGASRFSLSLSRDGNTLVMGADERPGNGSGNVRVYQFDEASATWMQRGQEITGDTPNDRFGFSVSTSSDGNVFAAGAISDSTSTGYARVFEFSGSDWMQRGPDIFGESVDDRFGYSVSLSNGGDGLAVGAQLNAGSFPNAGHVRLYQYESSTPSWTQVGEDIDGAAALDESGTSVSLSGNGTVVAIGAPGNDGAAENAGHVRVFGKN